MSSNMSSNTLNTLGLFGDRSNPNTRNNSSIFSFGRRRQNFLNNLIKLQNPNSNLDLFLEDVDTQTNHNEQQTEISKYLNGFYQIDDINEDDQEEDDQELLAAKDDFEKYKDLLLFIDTNTFTEFSNVYPDIIDKLSLEEETRKRINEKLNTIKTLAQSFTDENDVDSNNENDVDSNKRLISILQNQNIKLQIAINAIEILQELTGDYTNETAFEFLIILKRRTDKSLTELCGGKRASAKPRYSRRRSIRSKPTRRYGRRPSRKSASRRRKVLRRVSRKR